MNLADFAKAQAAGNFTTKITNKGTISGSNAAIVGSAHNDTLINEETTKLVGKIIMGAGEDAAKLAGSLEDVTAIIATT